MKLWEMSKEETEAMLQGAMNGVRALAPPGSDVLIMIVEVDRHERDISRYISTKDPHRFVRLLRRAADRFEQGEKDL